jgi:arsenate reductase
LRNTLALLRYAGIVPEVVEDLRTAPTREKVRELIAAMGISVRALVSTDDRTVHEKRRRADR